MAALFSDIQNVIKSFKNVKKPDVIENNSKLEAIIHERLNPIEGFGFFESSASKKIEDKITEALVENGADISAENKKTIIEYYEKTMLNLQTKRTFWIRAIISMLILGGCLSYMLFSKSPNQDLLKFCSGFIGVVLGYWLK